MQDHEEGRDKVIDCNDNRRKPADRIAADRADITVKAVQDIAVGILIQSQPVCVYNLIKNIRLDVIIDINAQLRRDSADNAAECQTEDSTSHHNRNHDPQLARLIACDNIDHVFARHTADQPHGCTEDTEDHIENNSAFISCAVTEDPLPVVYNLAKSPVFPSGYEDIQRFKGGILIFILIFFVHQITPVCTVSPHRIHTVLLFKQYTFNIRKRQAS